MSKPMEGASVWDRPGLERQARMAAEDAEWIRFTRFPAGSVRWTLRIGRRTTRHLSVASLRAQPPRKGSR